MPGRVALQLDSSPDVDATCTCDPNVATQDECTHPLALPFATKIQWSVRYAPVTKTPLAQHTAFTLIPVAT